VTTVHRALTVSAADLRATLSNVAGSWATSSRSHVELAELPKPIHHRPPDPPRLVSYEDTLEDLEAVFSQGLASALATAGSLGAYEVGSPLDEHYGIVESPDHADGCWRMDPERFPADGDDSLQSWAARSIGAQLYVFVTFPADSTARVADLRRTLAEVVRYVAQVSVPWWFTTGVMRDGLGIDPPIPTRTLISDSTDPGLAALGDLDELLGDL